MNPVSQAGIAPSRRLGSWMRQGRMIRGEFHQVRSPLAARPEDQRPDSHRDRRREHQIGADAGQRSLQRTIPCHAFCLLFAALSRLRADLYQSMVDI